MGAYLRGLGFGYKAIHFMTHKGPTSVEWLAPDLAMEKEVAWFKLQPPRTIPLPEQRPGLHPPPEVIAAWSKLMPPPVVASPKRINETIAFKRAAPTPSEGTNETVVVMRPRQWQWVDQDVRPQQVRESAQSPAPVTTSPEPVPSTGALPSWPLGHEPILSALSYAAQPTSIATTGSVPLAFGVPRPTPAPAPPSAPHGHSNGVRGDRAH
jgi:hypothetical protein